MMRLSRAAIVAVMLCLSVAGGHVKDACAMRFGPLTVRPYIEATTAYDDNVFVRNRDVVDDFFFLVSPGLLLHLGRNERNVIELEYRADVYRYVDTGAQNDVEDHWLRGLASFKLPGGLSLSFADLGSRGHEPRSVANQSVGAGQLNVFYNNKLDFVAGYEFSDRLKVDFDYQNYYLDFTDKVNDFRDRDENAASATAFYKILPKTSLLAQSVYRNIDHFNGTLAADRLDSDEYWLMAGATWDITAKSSGSVKVGYEWKEFGSDVRNYASPVYVVSATHSFTPRVAVTLTGSRQANESDDPEVPYYISGGGRLEVGVRPTAKIGLKPYVSYTNNRYAGATTAAGDRARRLDDVWAAGLDVTYDMNKWLALSLGYGHTKRSSSITFYDYTDNTAQLRLKAAL